MNLSIRTYLFSTLLVLCGQAVLSGAEKENSLAGVTRHMQQAHELLEQVPGTVKASTAQEQAIADLDAVIIQLTEKKKKCQGGGQGKPSDSKKPKPAKPSGAKKAGGQAATSAPASTSGTANQQLAAATTQLVKDLWGHLPERQQEQILQPLGEEFLPQYAEEISAYFRDLAEPKNIRQESP